MSVSRFLPLCFFVAVACAGAEPPPPVPQTAPARSLRTPTLSALAGEDAGAEPKDDGCGAGCPALSCRAGRLEKAGDAKAQRERAKILGKLYLECCRLEPKDPSCKDPSEVTREMAGAHRAAGDEGFALATELSLLNPLRFPSSAATERVKKELTERAEKIESAVKTQPTREGLAEELFTAVRIRAALGDEKALLRDSATFEKLYEKSAPILAAEVEIEVGVYYARAKKFALSSRHAASLLPQLKPLGRLDLELRTRALAARSQFEQKQRAAASKEIESMLKDWAARGPAFLSSVAESEPARAGQALTSIGEALFLRAEEAREKADALIAPRFTGARNKTEVLNFIQKDAKSWIEKRRKLIDEATRRYSEVLDLKPSPPPKWVVHSSARTGQMLDAFTSEFAKLPMPLEIERDPALARSYREALESASEPQVAAARAAFRTCQSFARRFDQEDELSRRCDEWLIQNPGPE